MCHVLHNLSALGSVKRAEGVVTVQGSSPRHQESLPAVDGTALKSVQEMVMNCVDKTDVDGVTCLGASSSPVAFLPSTWLQFCMQPGTVAMYASHIDRMQP
jgi:hypothetical protein